MKRIDAYWYSNNPVAWLFLPVSWIFCSVALIRRWLYRIGLLKSFSVPVPVIVIGNIAVGGTGKTPLLIALCKLFESEGIKVGVVSRGYRGAFTGEKIIGEKNAPSEVGDEPFIISFRTNCPVAVGNDRVAAAKLLLENHQCNIILSDDGLQHYSLQRDYEVAVIDAGRNHGNGYCLPAGPLREPVRRLKEVDLVVYHNDANKDFSFNLEFSDAVNLLSGETKIIEEFRGKKVHAVAGIGYPSRFFDQLRNNGLDIIEHEFQDHHVFNESDLDFKDDNVIVMTEKDAVKCDFFRNSNAWYIPVTANLSTTLISRINHDIGHLVSKQ